MILDIMCKCIKCEECLERQKKYYNDNKEHITIRNNEYYKSNKYDIVKKVKEYQENNKYDIKSKANDKLECVSGGRYTKRNKSTHMKSKKHEVYISKTINPDISNV